VHTRTWKISKGPLETADCAVIQLPNKLTRENINKLRRYVEALALEASITWEPEVIDLKDPRDPPEVAIDGCFIEHDLFGVDPLFGPTGPSGRSVIHDADARPTLAALQNASRVATSLQGLMHPDIDFDVLGGISLNYYWPAGCEEGKAERWAWVACTNTGPITCICHVRGEEPRSSFTIPTDHLMSKGTSRLATFLTTGKSD
jgi:hypothetical protein